MTHSYICHIKHCNFSRTSSSPLYCLWYLSLLLLFICPSAPGGCSGVCFSQPRLSLEKKFFSTIWLQVCTDSTLGVQKRGWGSWWWRKREKRTKGKVKPVSQSPFCSAVSGEETSARLTLSHKHTHTQSNTHLTSPRGRFLPHRCPELSKNNKERWREKKQVREKEMGHMGLWVWFWYEVEYQEY